MELVRIDRREIYFRGSWGYSPGMLKTIVAIVNWLFAPRSWEPEHGVAHPRMHRWRNGRWEYREMTREEMDDDLDMWAMK